MTQTEAEEEIQVYLSTHQCDSQSEVFEIYAQWANTYDKSNEITGFIDVAKTGAKFCWKYVKNSTDSTVLDIAGGTGVIGQYLRREGYKGNIDILDGCLEMLREASKKEIGCRCLIQHIITGGIPFLQDESYDGVTLCGALIPDYLPPSTVEVALRLVKVGGYLIINDEKGDDQGYYKKLHETISKLEADKKMKQIEEKACELNVGEVHIDYVVRAFHKLSN